MLVYNSIAICRLLNYIHFIWRQAGAILRSRDLWGCFPRCFIMLKSKACKVCWHSLGQRKVNVGSPARALDEGRWGSRGRAPSPAIPVCSCSTQQYMELLAILHPPSECISPSSKVTRDLYLYLASIKGQALPEDLVMRSGFSAFECDQYSSWNRRIS